MAGGGKVIFRDKTHLWVPLVTVLIIVVVFWGGMAWETDDLPLTTIASLVLLGLLLLMLPLQGRLFWTNEIAELAVTESGLEARTNRWVGPGRRLQFSRAEASWRPINDARPRLIMTVGSKDYELDLKSGEVLDAVELRRLAPDAMAVLAHGPAGT